MKVVDLLVTGVKLFGDSPPTGIWQPDPTKGAKTDAHMMWAGAREVQKRVLNQTGEWSDLDQNLWDLTLEEVAVGGLVGPLSADCVYY